MRKYVIMGVQGSGKGTQAGLLATDLDLVHVSVGDTFRWHVQHHTKIGAQVRRTMAAGELVDDDLVEAIVRDRLAIHDWNYGFILDGFPRNARQAEFFLESYDIDGVINLELPDEVVHERVLARRLCSGCGLDWNLLAHRPKVPDVCDICGVAAGGPGGRQTGGAGGAPARLPRQDGAGPRAVRAQGVRRLLRCHPAGRRDPGRDQDPVRPPRASPPTRPDRRRRHLGRVIVPTR